MSAATTTPAMPAPCALRGTPPAGSPLRALYLPFDLMRSLRGHAVRAGWTQNSMLASRDFERALHRLERRALGRYARCV